MRYLHFLGAILAVSTASAAWAQTGNYGGTPSAQPSQSLHLPPNVPADAYRPWNGAAPAATTNTAMPDTREVPASPSNAMRPGEMIDSVGEGAIPALVSVVQQEGDVTFINGGISDEDVAALKSKADEFNLHLLISAASGEFVSDIKLQVMDASGKAVLALSDAGPYVYAHLKPGAYTLEATAANGDRKTLKVKVPAKGSTKAHFGFNE